MGRGRLRFASAALTGVLLACGASGPPPSSIGDADRMAMAPLEDFERRHGIPEAGRALAAAREARERLEAARVADRFAEARREELAFLNHLVPGFEAYLANPEAAGALQTLEGIVTRGRRHRELAREALRKEARRAPPGRS